MHERINFNKGTLNIFTDASVINRPYGFDSCAGAIAVIDDNSNDCVEKIQILRNSTNNFGEMYAIYLGVLLAYELKTLRCKNFNYINIFSDSLISVNDLKTWIYNWRISEDGILYSKSQNKPIENQTLICSIIDMIITFNLEVSFYHIKGHTNINTLTDLPALRAFAAKFRNLNKDIGSGMIDDNVLYKIVKYNDYVDNKSRDYLKDNTNGIMDEYPLLKRFNNWDLNKYRNLINPNIRK